MNFKGIVFEGGGSTAVGHIGAVSILEEKEILKNLKYFIGSSAGALIAAALACKIPIKEIKDLINNSSLIRFLDPNICLPYWLYKIYTKDGIFKGDELEEWYGSFLKKYTGNENITFQEVYDKFGNFLELTVTDVTMCETKYINKDNYPNAQIKTIVRRSSMIPILYQTTNENMDTKINTNGIEQIVNIPHIFTDGGLMDNYPMHRLSSYLQPDEILGVKLMSSIQLNELNHGEVPYTPKNIFDFALTIFYMLRNMVLKSHIEDEDWIRTIKVDVCNYSSTDFILNDNDKDFLFEQGRLAAENFLDEYKSENVIKLIKYKYEKENTKEIFDNIIVGNKKIKRRRIKKIKKS